MFMNTKEQQTKQKNSNKKKDQIFLFLITKVNKDTRKAI